MRSNKGTAGLPASSSTLPLNESQLRSRSKNDGDCCMLMLISNCYNGCNGKSYNRNYQSIHEYVVRDAQSLVFCTQNHALRIHIFNKGAVQEVAVVHHLQHSRCIIFEAHFEKVP